MLRSLALNPRLYLQPIIDERQRAFEQAQQPQQPLVTPQSNTNFQPVAPAPQGERKKPKKSEDITDIHDIIKKDPETGKYPSTNKVRTFFKKIIEDHNSKMMEKFENEINELKI